MLDWLQQHFPADKELLFADIVWRLIASLLLGAIVAGIYRMTRKATTERSPNLTATLLLLSILIAMVTLAIGGNVARAFSLVGALAIVRFRTVVEDTRDTAFVIFAVAVGLSVGAGFLIVPAVGIPIAGAVAFAFYFADKQKMPICRDEFRLIIRVASTVQPALWKDLFDKYVRSHKTEAIGTAKQGTSLDMQYSIRLYREEDALAIVKELHSREGIQSVEIKVQND